MRVCVIPRNDDYLAREGLAIPPSLDFLFSEPCAADDDDEDAPDPTHDSELASDDPLDLPPPPMELLEVRGGTGGAVPLEER